MITKLLLKFTFIFALVLSSFASASELVGKWSGSLDVGGQSVPLILNISKSDGVLNATLDSPAQAAKGIPVESVEQDNENITFYIAVAGATYTAKLTQGKMVGVWNQSGQTFPLEMKKGTGSILKKK
jgi:hypothetical protein